MKHIVIFIFVMSVFNSSCSRKNLDSVEQQSYRYLALGDSYTIGEGVEEKMRWPIQLSQRLAEQGIQLSSVEIIATTGWTTRDLLDGIEETKPSEHDIVSLLIGVNNQYQGLAFSTFTQELDELLQTAISLAGEKKKVFVVSIPDYGVTPFGTTKRTQIANELNQYNEYTQQICKSLNIPHIDITEISRILEGVDGALATDNLHPSGFQYGKWAEEILPVVKKLIKD